METTFKSYKVNERATIAGLSVGQWAAAVPALAISYVFFRYVPGPLYGKLFFVPLGLGCWMLGVYLSGYLELNLLRGMWQMLGWLRSDDRYVAGAEPAAQGLLIERPEREPRPAWVFEPLGMDELARLAGVERNDARRNGARRAIVQAGGDGESRTREVR